jgi:hypothetical protein
MMSFIVTEYTILGFCKIQDKIFAFFIYIVLECEGLNFYHMKKIISTLVILTTLSTQMSLVSAATGTLSGEFAAINTAITSGVSLDSAPSTTSVPTSSNTLGVTKLVIVSQNS